MSKKEAGSTDTTIAEVKVKGLALLRKPFEQKHINRLPKPAKWQTDALKANKKLGIKCKQCGGWHHKDVVHLDYVGHAALTSRLLDADPDWNWEPLAKTPEGLPLFDSAGGLWIKITILGVTRMGYGSADGKKGGDAVKEVIGDALRNGGMRFGAALDLWHKGQEPLYHEEQPDTDLEPKTAEGQAAPSSEKKKKKEQSGKEQLTPENKQRWFVAMHRFQENEFEKVTAHVSVSAKTKALLEKDALKPHIYKCPELDGQEVGLVECGISCPTSKFNGCPVHN